LKDFAKVSLAPGESKTVSVTLPKLDVTSYWDSYKNKWLSEKNTYKVLVGSASDKISSSAEFKTENDVWWSGV
ncbi:hypothetical protein OXX80_013495, partial [Metschnikowia pulcherrima]